MRGHRAAQRDGGEGGAVEEGTVADGGKAGGEGDAGKGGAAVEGVVADGGEAGGEVDGDERLPVQATETRNSITGGGAPLSRCSLAQAEGMAAEEASTRLPGLLQTASWAD